MHHEIEVIPSELSQIRIGDFLSDNPALQQAAQEHIIHWRFKLYLDHGIPVEVISTLTPFSVNQAAAAAVPAKP